MTVSRVVWSDHNSMVSIVPIVQNFLVRSVFLCDWYSKTNICSAPVKTTVSNWLVPLLQKMETTTAILWVHPPAWIWWWYAWRYAPPPKKNDDLANTQHITRFVSPHSWGDYSLWGKWREIWCPSTFLGILPFSRNSFHTCTIYQ